MSTELQKTISVRILEDNSQVFIENFTNVTTVTQYVDKQVTVAAGTTDQAINISPITSAKEIYIESTVQISMKLNDIANPAIFIKDIAYLSTDGITAIYLSNSSAQSATVRIVVA